MTFENWQRISMLEPTLPQVELQWRDPFFVREAAAEIALELGRQRIGPSRT